MYILETDRTTKKTAVTKRNSPQYVQSMRHSNLNLPQTRMTPSERKKNLNLQSIKFLSNDFANQQLRQNIKENKGLRHVEQIGRINSSQQMTKAKQPFANATNNNDCKGDKSYSIRATKKKPQHQRELSQRLDQKKENSHALNQRPKALYQKLCEQKLAGIGDNKRKNLTYRIHLSSSKDKENNINSTNRVQPTSQQRALQFFVQNSQKSQQKSQSYPTIEEDMTKKQVTNRQQSSHSFMIRKKINSIIIQSQKPGKESNKTVHWSKSYRKDKFTKEEVLQVGATPKVIQQKAQAQQVTKTQVKQERAQETIHQDLPLESIQNIKKIDVLKAGKSLKMRKNKFSKPIDLVTYEEIRTETNKDEEVYTRNTKQRFHNTLDEDLEFKKVHLIENLKGAIKLEQNFNGNKATGEQSHYNIQSLVQKRQFLQEKQPEFCQQIQQQNNQKRTLLQSQKQQAITERQNELILSNPGRVGRRRVSSIRALKNLFRNFGSQEKQNLSEQKNIEQMKKKQKQTTCLTHKIRWGNQTRRKSSSQNILAFINNQAVVQSATGEYKETKEYYEVNQINIDKAEITLKSDEKKKIKKIRFQDEEIETQSQELLAIKSKVGFRKDSFDVIVQKEKERSQSSRQPQQTIGSRSMIVFDDPGISVIVKKNSSLQSSAHVYSTIEHELSMNEDEKLENKQNYEGAAGKRRRLVKDDNQLKLQSLKELFQQLRSHKSIMIDESC